MIHVSIGTGIILLGGIISLLCAPRARGVITAIGVGIGSVLIGYVSIRVLCLGIPPTAAVSLPFPIGNAVFSLDALSAFFALLIAVAGTLTSFYAIGYTNAYDDRRGHFFFFALLIASMFAVVTCRHAVAFLVCWELMTIASFFAILFDTENETVLKAAVEYLIAMHIGVLFLMSAFLLSWKACGSMDMASFSACFAAGDLKNIVFILFFAGFAVKAGLMPVHTWLPTAHSAAPSHVSALMSGVMIKLGIYGIFRTLASVGLPSAWVSWGFIAIAAVTALVGIAYALAQSDIKRLLAYSSVENIGIIGMGMALGMLGMTYGNTPMAAAGFAGALIHTINHSFFKTLLFSAAGAVYVRTHTRDMEQLGGLAKIMPFTAVCFLAGSIAISGLPLFNGFIGEFLIYRSIIHGIPSSAGTSLVFILLFALLAFVGAMAIICFTKAFSIMFQGLPRTDAAKHASEVSPVMLVPMGLFSILCIIIGVFPEPVLSVVSAPLTLYLDARVFISGVIPIFGTISLMLGICAALIGILAAVRVMLLRGRTVSRTKTWDCGYTAPTPRMQYTGSSFVAPFIAMTRIFSGITTFVRKPEGFFPAHASFRTKRRDILDRRAIKPFTALVRRTLDRFSWIQSGSTQQYILFGVIFLCIMLVCAVGIRW
ncbi:MAG: proton-conducting transporter membrane subunit [Spirochaetota bacterium]